MPSVNSVRFDVSGWERVSPSELPREVRSQHCLAWTNEAGDLLTVNFFPIPPDIPVPLSALAELRDFYRKSVDQVGGGLISVDVLSVKGVPAVQTLFKFPQQPHGMGYVGALTLPFAGFSHVIKVQCQEHGTTGVRESIVTAQLIAAKAIDLSGMKPGRPLPGWQQDLYDPTLEEGLLRNVAEDEKYNADFPDHPLSRTRRYLAAFEQSLELEDDLLRSPRFQGPSPSPGRDSVLKRLFRRDR